MKSFLHRACVLASTLTAFVLLASGATAAQKHAVIVGVSQYPGLPASMNMTFTDWGPRNSALLWYDTLKKRGFDDIKLLTDGVAKTLVDASLVPPIDKGLKAVPPGTQLPTLANIERALSGLESALQKSGGKDDVVIVFIGHGAYQPAAPGDRDEPTGQDEVFLVRDSKAPGSDKRFAIAILDNDIKRHLKALTAHAGKVWFVFDQCYAGTMTYAQRRNYLPDLKPGSGDSSGLNFNNTAASSQFNLHPRNSPAQQTMFSRQDLAPSDDILHRRPVAEPGWPTNYVAFYAVNAKAEAQTTYRSSPGLEALLKDTPPEMTALSYYVLSELAQNPKASFLQLLRSAREGYTRVDSLKGLKPLAEGNDALLAQPALP